MGGGVDVCLCGGEGRYFKERVTICYVICNATQQLPW